MKHFAQSIAAAAVLTFMAAPVGAASKEELDAQVREATEALYKHSSAAKELAGRASGMLVFPKVVKAGIGIGGEYGEGALTDRRQVGGLLQYRGRLRSACSSALRRKSR